MEFRFFVKQGCYTCVDIESTEYPLLAQQLVSQGFIGIAESISAPSQQEAHKIYDNLHHPCVDRLSRLMTVIEQTR